MDNNAGDTQSVFDHKKSLRQLVAQNTLTQKFPILAQLLPMLTSFRPKKVKQGDRQKGTFCLQCCLEEIQKSQIFDFNRTNPQEQDLELALGKLTEILNKAYASLCVVFLPQGSR